ncbi:MAG: hypothetical protein WDO19_17775 [Bacteroidota bacterium]
MREKLNWWWFLFFGGIIIPGIFFGILKIDPFYIYFKHFFITGFNPFVIHFLNFLIILLVCLLFKLINRLHDHSIKLSYCVAGIAIAIFILIGSFLEDNSFTLSPAVRRYTGGPEFIEKNQSYWASILPGVIIIALFILFFIKNFPKKLRSS